MPGTWRLKGGISRREGRENPVRESSVTNPDAKHLKDFHSGDFWVLECVVDLHFGAEGHPVSVLAGSFVTGDVFASNACLRKAEITKEVISEGGLKVCQEPGY